MKKSKLVTRYLYNKIPYGSVYDLHCYCCHDDYKICLFLNGRILSQVMASYMISKVLSHSKSD